MGPTTNGKDKPICLESMWRLVLGNGELNLKKKGGGDSINHSMIEKRFCILGLKSFTDNS